jgi:hypothetical protein
MGPLFENFALSRHRAGFFSLLYRIIVGLEQMPDTHNLIFLH